MHKEIIEWAHSRGLFIAINSINHLHNAKDKVLKLKKEGEVNSELFEKYMSPFEESPNVSLQAYKSILIMALPRPAHIVSFQMDDVIFTALLPPTYVNYRPVFTRYHEDFLRIFNGKLGDVALIRAPLKTLAVKLGLAAYGKNNISYVEGTGSYHQLIGFAVEKELEPYCDFPAPNKDMLEQCSACDICSKLCPTKAINNGRFLLRAEQCLTFFNEIEGQLPEITSVPSKLNPCFLGCMVCQEFCPVNKGMLRIEPTGVIFTNEETNDILNGENDTDVWKGIQNKLDKMGIMDCKAIMGRNLRFALAIQQRRNSEQLKAN